MLIPMTPITVDRLTKRYGRHVVLDQVSLDVRDGELFVLLGGSGSGKSTILRLIAGLQQPDGGQIFLHGQEVTRLPAQQRGTGFVFQNYSIFRHMSVAENIEFGLKIRHISAAERARRRDELLDLVGLMGLGDRYADQLSGGQLQRVALARALAYEPKVLLLDEPFGALDVKIRVQLRRSLKEVQRRLRVATILVTHDQEEAFELADRIGVLERGRLLEVGEPEGLYTRPRSLAVATFLGGGTVLAARAHQGQLPVGASVLAIPPAVSCADGDWVPVLVRPEQVALSAEPPETAAGVLDDGAFGAADRPGGPRWDSTRYEVAGRPGTAGTNGTGVALLGKGTVVEQTFSGAYRRVRVRLPRPAGVRQVAPAIPFGEEGLLVDAVAPSEAPLAGPDLWVSVRGCHLLEPPPARLLVYDTPTGNGAALALAQSMAERLQASVTILGVAEHADAVDTLRTALEERRRARGLLYAQVKVRQGSPADQIAVEQQAAFYEFVVVAGGRPAARADAGAHRLDAMAAEVLDRPAIPVLVAGDAPAAPATPRPRVLICTAAGEPGKSDIRVGGWLARRLDAPATLLYVCRDPAGPSAQVRRHLDLAVAALHSLEVDAEVQVRTASSAVEGILEEIGTGRHSVTVLGSHGPQFHSLTGRDDVTRQVIARAGQPVLVVPAEE